MWYSLLVMILIIPTVHGQLYISMICLIGLIISVYFCTQVVVCSKLLRLCESITKSNYPIKSPVFTRLMITSQPTSYCGRDWWLLYFISYIKPSHVNSSTQTHLSCSECSKLWANTCAVDLEELWGKRIWEKIKPAIWLETTTNSILVLVWY